MMREAPSGIVGLHPRDPIGVHVSTGIKGANGAPDFKGRFWLTTQQTHSQEFTTGAGKQFRQLARDLHPAFAAWNDIAMKLGRDLSRRGPGRVGMLRGNLVHARWKDAALWNRAAQKLPEGHPNPPSRRPACEGNGVRANRFRGVQDGQEVFESIACPNRECVFAMSGLCRPSAHLIFRLRWNPEDPLEAPFPALLAEWNTRGWHSLENLMGLFEVVLGTEALLTEEERRFATEEERAKWKTGLAGELGVGEPSLVGMPLVLTVGEKTKAADAGSAQGKRFTVVSFSPDGDLVEWLLAQARNRRELAGGAPALLQLPASTRDADFIEEIRHESRVEIDPSAVVEVATDAPATVKLLSPKKVARLTEMAAAAGAMEALQREAARLVGTGDLAGVPAEFETDLLSFVARQTPPPRSSKRRS